MKIAYVTAYDASDRSKWSSLGYYIARALDQQAHGLAYVGPLRVKQRWYFWAKKLMYTRLRKQNYLYDREPKVVRGFAREASARLSQLDVDVIFSPGTVPIAYLESNQPIVFWTDATFAGMIDFYPEFTNLCPETLAGGTALETAALDRAALAIYSSEWAAQTAIDSYGIARSKVHVVPFGANIETAPTLGAVRKMVAARSAKVCKLLFLGVTWFRKGGDVALEVVRQLNAAGLTTELVVVGCKPRLKGRVPDFVHYRGTIGKSSPNRHQQLMDLMTETHFLILPSRADCTPVVFSEANAFGVPCVASAVGGISSIIRRDVNGATFGRDASPSSYAEYIWNHFHNRKHYEELALSAFHEYETRLNWKVAGRAALDLMAGIRA